MYNDLIQKIHFILLFDQHRTCTQTHTQTQTYTHNHLLPLFPLLCMHQTCNITKGVLVKATCSTILTQMSISMCNVLNFPVGCQNRYGDIFKEVMLKAPELNKNENPEIS